MLTVIVGHGAHALAGTQFLCYDAGNVGREENQAVPNMLTDGPHVAPERRYSDVIARRDFPRYKSICKDAVDEGGGGSETNHCTVPREVCKNWETGLGLSELCEKL